MRAVAMVLWFGSVATAEPITLAQSGRLLDASGSGVDGARSVRFTVYEGGVSAWTRVYPIDLADGFYTVVLGGAGDGGVVLDSSHVDAATAEVGVTIGADPELAPRTALVHVPRAAVASAVPTAGAGAATSCVGEGSIRWRSDLDALQVCDGAAWIGVGSTASGTQNLVVDSGHREWSDGTYAKSCHFYRHQATNSGYEYAGATGDGVYRVDPTGASAFDVWCDMTSDTGGWTLAEVGLANNSGDLRTNGAVNNVLSPTVTASGKLSRAQVADLAYTGGIGKFKYGHASVGFLYLSNLLESGVRNGVGTVGFGTANVPNVASASFGGPTYASTLYDWPAHSRPEVCLNSSGTASECSGGLHVGNWSGTHYQDAAYLQPGGSSNHPYFLWVK
jgi:hypothetical protein